MREKDLSNLIEQAEEMSELWRNRVRWRMTEYDAFHAMPPLQQTVTFGDYFCIRGEIVGRIPSLTDFLQRAVEEEIDDDSRDFLTACALYDAQMGWFAADVWTEEGVMSSVVHSSMVFPVPREVHDAMIVVDCDPDRLNPSDFELLKAAIAADEESTEEWIRAKGDSE